MAVLCSAGRAPAQQIVNAFPNLTFLQPILLTNAGDGSDRIFVVQQTGVIYVFPNDSTAASATKFLDISDSVASSYNTEAGLLGLAFHPDFAHNGYFYVDYVAPNPLRTVVSRYKVSPANPNKADTTSAYVLLEIPREYNNHNGGMLAFGPDGMLYIGVGDGGSEGDPSNYGQNRSVLYGKILRIDVNDTTATTRYRIPADNPFAGNGSGYREEIWAYGLRNPWRYSFDPATGRLWAGDVGQDSYEEIDIINGGHNYGWKIMEGFACYSPPTGCDTTGLTMPIVDYDHSQGQAVVGGYVYHGSRRPDLAGAYLYADWAAGKIWMLEYNNGAVSKDSLLTSAPFEISAFGVDEHQELYIVSHSFGNLTAIYRFAGNPVAGVGKVPTVPHTFILRQNYPNPFNPSTKISFEVGAPGPVRLGVFDVLGREVAELVNGRREAGDYTVTFDASSLASGVYICRMVSGSFSATRKLLLIR